MNNYYTNKAINLVENARKQLKKRRTLADPSIVALIAQLQWFIDEQRKLKRHRKR